MTNKNMRTKRKVCKPKKVKQPSHTKVIMDNGIEYILQGKIISTSEGNYNTSKKKMSDKGGA